MNEHVSTEQLADHAAGLLEPARERQVARHLPDCPDCTARLESVRHASRVLAAQSAPRMPEAVFARLHQSIDALASSGLPNADFPEDRREQPRVSADPLTNYPLDEPSSHPVGNESAESESVITIGDSREARDGTAEMRNGALPASISGGSTPVSGRRRRSMGSLEANLRSTPARRRRPAKIAFAALGACALAGVVGFGGYVLSAASGRNEPAANAPLVLEGGQLGGEAAELQDRSGLSPHRFSEAWNCARAVTSGRITGIRASVLNDRSGFLVFLAGSGDSTRVVFVSGCGTATPSAGPSTVLPKG